MKERMTFNLKNLLHKTPRWASISLFAWSTLYGIYLICTTNEIIHLSNILEHKIDGIYGIGNLIFLSFGGHKITNISEIADGGDQQPSDEGEKQN